MWPPWKYKQTKMESSAIWYWQWWNTSVLRGCLKIMIVLHKNLINEKRNEPWHLPQYQQALFWKRSLFHLNMTCAEMIVFVSPQTNQNSIKLPVCDKMELPPVVLGFTISLRPSSSQILNILGLERLPTNRWTNEMALALSWIFHSLYLVKASPLREQTAVPYRPFFI